MKIGIDLGGTNMRLGIVHGEEIVKKEIIPCPAKESAEAVLETLCGLIERNMRPSVTGIGIGVPTLVDSERGIVYNATNIPAWKEVNLKQALVNRFALPVEVNNDANCFTLGEARFGCGRGHASVVGVTLGTGVGGGIVIDGKLYNGRNTGACEIGELPYRDHNFEHYCSSVFFEREYGVSGREAAESARSGSDEAKAIWNEFGDNFGHLLKAVMFAYDPEVIVIGGGISSAYPLYAEAALKVVSTFPYSASLNNLTINVASLADVAILGASALV